MTQPATLRPSIPTLYRGTVFRSKLEADWARWFDRYGMEWQHEPCGLYCGDQFVCPDFWLPQARQWFEVKATLSDHDVKRFSALLGEIERESECCETRPFMVFGWPKEVVSLCWRAGPERLDFCREAATLVKCLECRTPYFVDRDGSWTCARCGRGGNGIEWMLSPDR